MNPRAKGNRNEIKAVKELEADGWLVYRVRGSSNRFNLNNDIFSLFDIVCIKPNPYGVTTRYIQVKSNIKPNLKPFKEFKAKYNDLDLKVELWIWKDRIGFNKTIIY